MHYERRYCSETLASTGAAAMYPAEVLALFPPFPRNNRVFVAMSFDDRFQLRFDEVLRPAIEGIEYLGQKLVAHRVDLTIKSDSIVTEIVQEIAQCRLVVADLSTLGVISESQSRPVRNANVFYEVGLAHASRLPEEVILLRSDNDKLDFDIAGVRVHEYDPDNVESARAEVQRLARSALESIDLRKSIAVKKGLQSLDFTMYGVLQEAISDIPHPKLRTVADILAGTDRLNAIYRLLSSSMLHAVLKPLAPELMDGPRVLEDAHAYRATEFGRTVLMAARDQQGFNEAFIAWTRTPEGEDWMRAVTQASKKS